MSVHCVECIDPVISVAVGRQVRAAVSLYASPIKAIGSKVAGRHVFDHYAVGFEYANTVFKLELSIEDHRIAVKSPQRQVVRRDINIFVVDPRANQDEGARLCRINGILDGGLVSRNRNSHGRI